MKQGSVSAMGEPLIYTFLPGNNLVLVNVFKTQPHAWEVVAQIFSKCFVRCERGQRQERGYATSFTPLVSLPYISVHRNLHQFKCISNKQFYLYWYHWGYPCRYLQKSNLLPPSPKKKSHSFLSPISSQENGHSSIYTDIIGDIPADIFKNQTCFLRPEKKSHSFF